MAAQRDPDTGKFVPSKEETVETSVETPADKAVDEKVVVTPEKEETKEPVVTVAPKIDTEAIKADLKGQITEELADKIYKSLTGKTIEENPNEPPWEKEKRNPYNYTEIAQWAKEQAKTELNSEIEADEKVAKEQEEQQKDSQKKNVDAWNKYWDGQLDELVTEGLIPPVKDAKDENDPGRKARLALFESMNKVSAERTAKGQPPVTDLYHVYHRFYKDPNQKPAGAYAPVSGARRSVSSSNGNQLFPSYRAMKDTPIDAILRGEA